MRRGLFHPSRPAPERSDALSVTELTLRIKSMLETGIGPVSVRGEVSGLKASPSGHVYFSLKDQNALVDAVIWRSAAARIGALPRDGTLVVAGGRLGVYEPRGRYQLIVTSIREAGRGDLQREFELLKEKLAAEGLFAYERKIPIPEAPLAIGIVTSPTGAALRDMLKIIRRRSPWTRIVLSPCQVQGKGAAREIAGAVARLDGWGGVDVIIVGRGGGSLEDLWAFNEEPVARAVAAARTPIVSAVGHETDVTICDLVADVRAATPSEAAEMCVPDAGRLRDRLRHTARTLGRALAGRLREDRLRLENAAGRPAYSRPRDMLMSRWQRLDEAHRDLRQGMERLLERASRRHELLSTRLEGISPLRVLSRGYAVVMNAEGAVITDPAQVAAGETITARVAKGEIRAVVSP